MMRNGAIPWVLLMLAACTTPDRADAPPAIDSPVAATVEATSFPDVSTVVGMALLADTAAVMLDGSAPFLKVVRLRDGTMLDSFAAFGAGPGELRDPHWIDLQPEDPESSWMLVIHEPNQRGVSRWRITDRITFLGRSTTTGHRVDGVLALGDTLIGATIGDHPSPLQRADGLEFGGEGFLGTAPYLAAALPKTVLFDANQLTLVGDERSGMIAAAFFYAPELQLVSADGRRTTRWRDPRPWSDPVPHQWPNPGFSADSSMIGFLAVGASRAGVVGVFCGCRGAVRLQAPLELVVLDWEGTLRARITVPTGVRAVDLSEDGRFAVIAYDAPDTKLARVAIPAP
jgi:hypothetical protein